MPNPFDDEEGTFHVLVNDEGQYSLWPDFAEVPPGWSVELTSVPRASALAHVQARWTSLEPASLRRAVQREQGRAGAGEPVVMPAAAVPARP